MLNINENLGRPNEFIFSVKELLTLYVNRRNNELSRKLIEILEYLRDNMFLNLNLETQIFVDAFADTFLYLFTRDDYIVNPEYGERFIKLGPVITNIISVSCYKNTDAQLKAVENHEENFFKILPLYSSRNKLKLFPYKLFFDVDAGYSSLWYFYYFATLTFATENMTENVIRHINNIDSRLIFSTNSLNSAYFACTYYDPDNSPELKRKINSLIKGSFKNVRLNNNPNKKKIAIASAKWFKTSAVYKSSFDFIKLLSEDYDLTLLHLGDPLNEIEISLFKDIRYIQLYKGKMNLSAINNNDFELIYYPDIGMSSESIYLSNLRIAPVQVTSYGHPVSTFGSEIDYFIGGSDVEIADHAEKNYSEKLILIPGLGAYPVYPDYEKKYIKKTKEEFIINCLWSARKYNYEILKNLKQIIKMSDKKILFRFFIGDIPDQNNSYIPLHKDLENLLGKDSFELILYRNYDKYMELIEEGDISIDSYPFGGYNTIVDSLYLGKPVVTYEGDKAYNRLASSLLRKIDLPELISTNKDEYIAKTVNLINNDNYREDLINKISKIDLRSKIFNTDEPIYFKKAIDSLIENYDREN